MQPDDRQGIPVIECWEDVNSTALVDDDTQSAKQGKTFTMKPTPTPIEAIAEYLKVRDEALGTPEADDAERLQSATDIAALSVPEAAVVGEPVDDWTVDDTETAGEILTLLDIGCDASKEPGADWRRDKIAKLIRARISQQDAELERVRREVEEAREQALFAKASDQAGDEYIDNMRGAIAALKIELAEARKAAFIEAAEIAETGDWYGQFQTSGDERRAKAIADRIRAKAEETRT